MSIVIKWHKCHSWTEHATESEQGLIVFHLTQRSLRKWVSPVYTKAWYWPVYQRLVLTSPPNTGSGTDNQICDWSPVCTGDKAEFNTVDFVESQQSQPCRFGPVHTGDKVRHIRAGDSQLCSGFVAHIRAGDSQLCSGFVAGFGNSRLCRQCVPGLTKTHKSQTHDKQVARGQEKSHKTTTQT